jgi:alginate O-acetyltransferase complex protein AlgI
MFAPHGFSLPVAVEQSLSPRHVLTLALSCLVFVLPHHWQMAGFITSTHRMAAWYRAFLLLAALPYALLLVFSGTFSPFLYFQF